MMNNRQPRNITVLPTRASTGRRSYSRGIVVICALCVVVGVLGACVLWQMSCSAPPALHTPDQSSSAPPSPVDDSQTARSALLDTTEPTPVASEGWRVRIPAIGVDAPLEPIGINDAGEIGAPSGPDVVGWYTLGPLPGNPGNAVLVGHVDWKTQTAVFWRLRELKPGDAILVASANRAEQAYVVEWVQSYPFDQAPIETIFESSYKPLLTLITCDGTFDPATHNYSHRLIVRARHR